MMKITQLRANIFQVFEKIEKTGIPVDVERNGKRFRIVSLTPVDKFTNARFLPDCIVGDPDRLDRIDWSKEWKP